MPLLGDALAIVGAGVSNVNFVGAASAVPPAALVPAGTSTV
jgi:hypothetical protein